MAESSVSMKLLVDRNERRVLFAEAGKECVDFLFYLLSLPVATIIRLLGDGGGEEGMEGSLPNLYKSLENLNDSYIQPNKKKDTYLKPVASISSSSVPLLALQYASTAGNISYSYSCGYCASKPRSCCYVKQMNSTSVGGLVKEVVTYMVEVKPMSTISSITLLNQFNVSNVPSLEEKVVNLGMNEIGIDIGEHMATTTVSMKLLIDTSKAPRVLFAEAGKECVDFLFHILSLPVATIIRLLSEVGMEGSLPKLYRSLQNLNNSYIQPGKQKDTFLKPVMPVSSSALPLLALEGPSSVGKKFYTCQYGCRYVSDDPRAKC